MPFTATTNSLFSPPVKFLLSLQYLGYLTALIFYDAIKFPDYILLLVYFVKWRCREFQVMLENIWQRKGKKYISSTISVTYMIILRRRFLNF